MKLNTLLELIFCCISLNSLIVCREFALISSRHVAETTFSYKEILMLRLIL